MGKSTFNQCFCRWMAVLFQQLLVKAAAVDADANGDLPILADIHHSLYPVFPANVAGVDPDLRRAAFRSGNGQLIIKMNIRHQRQLRLFADFRKPPSCFHIGYRQPGDLAAGFFQLPDLVQRTGHVRGLGIQHGLNHHRRTAANGNISNHNLSGQSTHPLKITKISLNRITAMRTSSRTMPAPWI